MMSLDDLHGDITTVLLDIGGVLYVDPWQTILLSPSAPDLGLAGQLDLDPAAVIEVAEELWPTFATKPLEEDEYWSCLGDRLSALTNTRVDFPASIVAETSERLLRPQAQAWSILAEAGGLVAAAGSRRIGVITDNTSFWYRRQYRDLHLSYFIDSPDLEFVSSKRGCRKSDDPGLFGLAAEICEPTQTLVIDDRQHNLDHAASFGFHVRKASPE